MKIVSRSRRRHAVLMALALPPLVLGLFALSSAYRIHASNQAVAAEKQFPQMAVPNKTQRILVFAPHCDDETLGAAGLMRQAERAGTPVHVVIFSNGDGFRVGVQRDFHELRVPPADFVRYAERRQTESESALARLGVPKGSITFLGFPDRGLLPLWTTNWTTPFPSAFTGTDHCPYPNSPLYKDAYTGQMLLNAVMNQMRRDRPTDVFVTHPADDHPDHAAASAFVQAALARCRADGDRWAQGATLHFYLGASGGLPVPQGLDEGMPLPPPAPMMGLDTRWAQLPLSADDTRAKFAAICRYRSQTELTGRFLYSFARTTELFGTLGQGGAVALPRVPDGRMTLAEKDWAGLSPVARDAAGDTVLRAFQASADVSRLWACRDSRFFVSATGHAPEPVAAGDVPVIVTPACAGRVVSRPGLCAPAHRAAWAGRPASGEWDALGVARKRVAGAGAARAGRIISGRFIFCRRHAVPGRRNPLCGRRH